MAKVWSFEVLASGHFKTGPGHHLVEGDGFRLRSHARRFFRERVPVCRLQSVRSISRDETGNGLAATLGLGVTGALLFGGAGLIGGLLLGNRRGSVAVVYVDLTDGRGFLAAMPPEAARYLVAMTGVYK